MLLWIIPTNFRQIPEIFKELERRPHDQIKKATMGNFQIPWNTEKLAEHSHFE